jgi:hypothetical protein
MVDRCGQLPKELLEGTCVVGIEGRGSSRADFTPRLLEPVAIAAGKDDIGPLRAGAPSCREPDACTAADEDNGLSNQFRFALNGNGYKTGFIAHDSSDDSPDPPMIHVVH